MEPLVSIIVAIYKVEEYLQQCIQTIIDQTYTNVEIILVDDGSPDECPTICDEFYKHDNKIQVIHKKNEGLVYARKDGLKLAKGKYVLMVDGDDYLDSHYIENLVVSAEKDNADIVVDSFLMSYPNREYVKTIYCPVGVYKNEKLQDLKTRFIYSGEYFEFGINPAVWNKLFIKEKLEKYYENIPQGITLGEDFAVSMPYMMSSECISILNSSSYYHYRQRATSMVKAYNSNLSDNINLLIRYLNTTKLEQTCLEQLQVYYSWLMICNLKNIVKCRVNIIEKSNMLGNTYKSFAAKEAIERTNNLPLKYQVVFKLLLKKHYLVLAIVLQCVIGYYLKKE